MVTPLEKNQKNRFHRFRHPLGARPPSPAALLVRDFIHGWSFLLAQPRVKPVLKPVQGSGFLIDRPQRNKGWT